MSAAVSYDMMMPLTLTPAEESLVVAEAERVLRETFAVSAAFVANNRTLPRGEWKHLKSRENVHVYRTMSTGSLSFTVPSSHQQHPSQEQHEVELSKPDELPYVVAFGTLPGTVEDAAFGVLGHTESITRQRDALMDDEYEAVKILATIHHPTPQDPFSSLVVKWSTKGIGALARSRDCVYLEAVGVTTDADGEQVAYYVMHSIDNIIPRVVGLRHLDIVRVDISLCSMCRRRDDSLLEIFCHGYVNTGGMFAEAKGDQLFPGTLLSSVHVIECAYVKKLIWLVHTKQLGQDDEVTSSKSRSSSDASSSLSHGNSGGSSKTIQHNSSSSGSSAGGGKTCSNCSASLSTLRNLIRSSSSCHACRHEVCHKCSVEKKIPVETSSSSSGFKLKQRSFCLRCLLEAKQAPTREVAGAMLELMS